jgi:hypothetical protein
LRQRRAVRWICLLLGLTTFSTFAQAQEQENKLVDRLLRPNMELSNPAQNRKFTTVEGTSVDKEFEAKQFYSGKESTSKTFWGGKSFLSKTFGTGEYARAEAAANATANAEIAYASQFADKKSSVGRKSSFAEKKTQGKDYADNRPFLGQGTRQKILSQQNHAMTIDEVRDLLNKSK